MAFSFAGEDLGRESTRRSVNLNCVVDRSRPRLRKRDSSQARAPAVHGLLNDFFLWELKFKFRHAHFPAAEFHAFHFQSKALVQTAFAWDRNTPSGGDHAMPRQSVRLAQCADNKARSTGKPRGTGHGPIGGNMAARNRQDRGADTLKIRVWLPGFGHHHILNTVKPEQACAAQKLVVVQFCRQAHRWRDDVCLKARDSQANH